MTTVARQKTHLSLTVATKAFRTAFVKVVGSQPNPNQIALLLAQSALETGRWKEIYNYNFGNIKASRNWGGLKTSFACSEVIGGKERHYPAGDPHCIFRAYADPASGAEDYLKVLCGNVNWKRGLLSGQPADFIKWLTAPDDPSTPKYEGKYFTASPERYLRGLTSLFKEYGGKVDSERKQKTAAQRAGINRGTGAMTAPMPKLQYGSQGVSAEMVQNLIRLFWGERNLVVDGDFGPKTRDAVKRVQAKLGIAQTGAVGEDFWREVLPQ